MKNTLRLLLALALGSTLATAHAQMGGRGGAMMGGPPAGPNFGGTMAKLFGDNSSFSANLEFQVKQTPDAAPMTMPGKISFDQGKSRFEMDMTKTTGGPMTPQMGAQMATMGMGSMVMISLPEKKLSYLIYPGLKAYVENPLKDSDTAAKPDQLKVETTELGKETVDGHACVKNKVIVTDEKGVKHESIVWNATDLKNFPVKIESSDNGTMVTMLFKDTKLGKVEASQFDPPSDFTKYADTMTLMMQEMMKRRGGGQ